MFRRSSDPDVRELRRRLGGLRRRLWLERAAAIGARALVFGFGIALLAAAAAWSTLTPLEPTYYGGPVAAALGLALVVSLFRYPSSMEAARAADHRLGLGERIGTAVELVGDRRGLDGPFGRRQLATAIDAAGWARKHWRGGPRIGRDVGVAVAFGILTAGILLLTGLEDRLPVPIPRPSIWSLLPREEPRPEPAIAEEPAPVATERPTATGQPRSGRTAAVTRALDDLRRGRESGAIGPQEASNRLSQAEAELGRQTQESRAQREALDRLGRALDQVAAGRPAAENIQRGDYDRAGEEIATLGTESDQLSPQAKAQLAQALRSAAAESQSTPDLAAKERRAADALAGRDYEAARRAMRELGEEVARRGRDVVPQQELARAWDQVNEERRSQGQSDSSASGQRQDRQDAAQRSSPSQSPPSASASQTSGSQSGSGAGSQPGEGGVGDDGSIGEGAAGEVGSQATSGPPGGQGIGEFQPSGQAKRLDVQGRPVEVDVKAGERAGRRPGEVDQDDTPNERPSDEVGSVSAVSGEAPRQITSAAPAESNFVPNDRRQVVRDYFSSGNGGEGNR